MFGFFGSKNDGWGSGPNDDYGFSSVLHNKNDRSCYGSDYESKRLRNERITRDYFHNIHGTDPVDLGFQVPDWDWS